MLALEAKRLQAAGYTVIGIHIGYDVVKAKKTIRFKQNWQTARMDTCLQNMFANDDQGLALVTGEASDLLAVDLDAPKAKDIELGVGNAIKVVNDLADQYGLHPSTPTATTPTGGMHMLFSLSKSLQEGLKSAANASKCANLTLDCRGDRGCLICHPSTVPYPDGPKQYTWTKPIVPVTDLQAAPSWLIHLLNQRGSNTCLTATTTRPTKRHRVDYTQDVFTYTVQDQMAKLVPGHQFGTVWPRAGGIDFKMANSACSCPLCGNTHVSNNFKARIILNDAFTLSNYSASCHSKVFGWEACRLLQNLIASPSTDDPYCNILQAIYQLQDRMIVYTEAKRFLSFNGIIWQQINSQIIKQDIKAIVQQVIKPLSFNIRTTHQSAFKALTAAQRHLEKAQHVTSITTTFETLSFDADIEEQMDTNPDLLAVGNGVVDLKKGTLERGMSFYKLATGISTKFQDSQTPLIDAFFSDIFNGDQDVIRYMQRLLGYGITGHTSAQVWAIWTGSGSNGKSLLMDILRQLMGPFAVMMPAELLFETGKTTAGASTPHLQALIKKRLGFKDEGKAEKANVLNEELIKTVTGSSAIATKPLYKEYIEFSPTHLPILLCNQKPRVNVNDSAMMRRIVVIPFSNVYTSPDSKAIPYDPSNPNHRLRDDELRGRLMSKAGQEQLLRWLVAGAAEWYKLGLGAMPDVVSKAYDCYREESDVLGTFITECCNVGQGLTVNASAFLQALNTHTSSNVKQKTLKDLMAKRGFTYSTHGGRNFRGLDLLLDV